MLKILTPDWAILPECGAGGAVRRRVLGQHRYLQANQVLHTGTMGGNGPQLLTVRIECTNPGHLHAPMRHHQFAHLAEQLHLIAAAHDRLVALAQRRIQLGQTLAATFGVLALRVNRTEFDMQPQPTDPELGA